MGWEPYWLLPPSARRPPACLFKVSSPFKRRSNNNDRLGAGMKLATNRAWRAALAAVAVGEVILCDKEKAGEYKKYNEGHVPDIVQPGASASAPGAPTGSVRPRCPRRSEPPPPRTSASTWGT